MTGTVTRHKFKSNLLQLLRLIWNYLERVSAAHQASSRFWESCLSTCTYTRGSMSFVMKKMQKLKNNRIALYNNCITIILFQPFDVGPVDFYFNGRFYCITVLYYVWAADFSLKCHHLKRTKLELTSQQDTCWSPTLAGYSSTEQTHKYEKVF